MLLVLTGKTASGKDTLITQILIKYLKFRKVLTTTSRSPRDGEKNGVDYNFLTEEEFINKISRGDFLEHVKYGGNYYGTEKSRINAEEDLIWKIDPSMAGKVKEMFPNCKVIYINADDKVILERLERRGISGEELQERMADDLKFWDTYRNNYDFVVENEPGNLEVALGKIYNIIDSQK